jgi:hypothetical protein
VRPGSGESPNVANAVPDFAPGKNRLHRALLELGTAIDSFDVLRKREWIMLAPYCADAGHPRVVTAAFVGKRRLRVTNVRGEVVGHVSIEGRRIPTPADVLEKGITAEPTGTLEVPLETPGGIYFIDNQWALVVSRPEASCAVVVPLSTMQAFNDWGGRSAYTERQRQRETGQKIALHHYSLRRPLARRFATDVLAGFFDWLPRGALAGEDIRFIPDYELARPNALASTRLLLIPGRSEYWTRESRRAVDAYVDNGGDMALLSSETMLHEIRHEEDRLAWWWWGAPEDPNSPALPYWYDPARRYPLIPSIGPNPGHGGSHKLEAELHPEWGMYRVYDCRSPLAKACGLESGQTIALRSTVYYDGLPVRWYKNDVPMLDERALPFHRWTLLGHSFGLDTPLQRIGAWFAFQRAPGSGRVVHFGSFAWSTMEGVGGTGPGGARPAEIVDATIRLMRSGAELFAPQPEPAAVPVGVRLKSLLRRRRVRR